VTNYSVRSEFEDEEAVERLRADRSRKSSASTPTPHRPLPEPLLRQQGGRRDSDGAQDRGAALRKVGPRRRVRVAVVDTGIDGSRVPVIGGWAPYPGYTPGTTPPDHGTMCAYDVRIAASEAAILDYALLQSAGATWGLPVGCHRRLLPI
jgi:hypothetical protein